MARINYSDFYKNINFDVDSQLKETYVVKQNDTLSRGFYVKVIQNGKVVQPSNYDKMTLYVKKPDGKDIFEDGTIISDRFKISLPNQALTVPGKMRAEFTLRGAGGEIISSQDFTIIVNESFPVDPVESTDEFGALQQALAQIAGFAGEIQDVQLFAESIKANLGELENLDTVDKENVVAAINELNGKIDNILNSEELETLLNAKVDKDTLGNPSELLTDEKEVIVNAINELFEDIEEIRSVSDVGEFIQLLNSKADKSTVGDITNLVDFEDEEVEINNLVEAINYTYQLLVTSLEDLGEINLEGLALSEDLGNKEELTTDDKSNIVNAINEINAALKEVESVTDVEQLSLLLSGKADKSSVGNLSELTTTQKNNLVNAINELKLIIDELGEVDFSEIYTLLDDKVDQADFDLAISTLQQNIDNIELTPGPPGQDGQDGKSAYQIWLDEGNEGTEQDFLDSLKGPQGPPGEPGEGGSGESGGSNLGSFSSNELIDSYSNIETMQVNVSKSSSTGKLGWLINVGTEPDEVWVAVDMNEIWGDWETDYLVDGAFVYAMVHHFGDDCYVEIEPKEMGEMNDWFELYPVKEGVTPILAQVNASNRSTASGNISQVNASNYGSTASGEVSQVNASIYGSTASGEVSQVNASNRSTASGYASQVNASSESTASGGISQVNASGSSTASGGISQVNASGSSTASGDVSQVNASDSSIANGHRSQVNASYNIKNNTDNSSAWGCGPWRVDPSTQNIKIHLLSESGDINHSGVLNSGHNFTDFAELFPNLTGEAQGYGLIQTIDGHGVRPANSGDQVVGVTSATAGVVLGETSFSWADRWLKDEWGAFIMEDVIDEDWEPGEGQTEEDRPVHRLPKENPEYDPEREYTKRQERPDEWTVVGLVGQVYVRLDENVEPMDYVKPLKDGVGQPSDKPTNIRVMKITQEFDKDKGYKIGFCLLS